MISLRIARQHASNFHRQMIAPKCGTLCEVYSRFTAGWKFVVKQNLGAGRRYRRNTVEFSALTTHLMWVEAVGDSQPELERIVHSLEANPFLRRYQRWSGRSQKG